MKRTAPEVQPANTPLDAGAAAEVEALALLGRAYQRDVEAMADSLKPRLAAGEFTGDRPGPLLGAGGRWVPDAANGFDALETLCRSHRRAAPPWARLTLAICPARTVKLCQEVGPVSEGCMAAFCLAFDVREYAIRHFRMPRDDYFQVEGGRAFRVRGKAPGTLGDGKKAAGRGGGDHGA